MSNSSKSTTSKFDVAMPGIRAWMVPPVLVPISFGLLIVAAVLVQW
ncbi:MAG: hypothetical protein WA418_30665 [Bradyrhizobium sp.]